MPPKLCMFCGDEVHPDQLTKEHFVPQGLWEKGHRPEKMRPLPAHKACNKAFSEDNEYFRDVMIMSVGAHQRHPEVQRLQAGAVHRKFKERFGSIVKTLRNLRMWHIRTPSGLYLGRRPVFEADWQRMKRVLCNIMKGVFYVSQKCPMPHDFIIDVSDVCHVNQEWLEKTVRFMCPWQSFGDTVFCCRYVVSSTKPITRMKCLMQFYEHKLYVGAAIAPELLGKDCDLFIPAKTGSSILVPRWTAER